MIDLAEFLLARYAGTEAEARQDDSVHLAPSWTTYILDDLDAKRRIVLLANAARDDDDDLLDQVRVMTLRLLALPYADHPDFREEWRP